MKEEIDRRAWLKDTKASYEKTKNNGTGGGYTNQYQLRHAKLIIMENANNKCEICGGEAKEVHHIDGTKNNHELNNLVALCFSCHGKAHRGKTSIYRREFGYSITEISLMVGCSTSWLSKNIKKDDIKDWVKEQIIKYEQTKENT